VTSREHGFGYQPALDGLRAFAVLAVFAYHLRWDWARGGYLGVDAFFVLSGYLITSLLLSEERRQGAIELAAFWARRARRLLPAVLLLMVAVAVYAATLVDPTQQESLRHDAWATLAYVANWRLIFSEQSYFDLFGAPSPLRHMWSLAIEEQFYVIWPLIVFGALRFARGSRRLLIGITGGGIVASAVWMAVAFDAADPSRVYYGTDTRAHSLLVGCLLALLLERRPAFPPHERRGVQVTGMLAAGAVLVMASVVSDQDDGMYRGGFLFYAVAVAIVITAAVQPTASPLRSVLSLRPVRWIGAISYGLYLWHWPAIVVLTDDRLGIEGWPLDLVRIAATFGVATLSYYFVEQPIRYGEFRNRAVLLSAPVMIAVLGTVVWTATLDAEEPPRALDANAPITAPPPPPSTNVPPTTATTVPPSVAPGATTTTTLPSAATAPPMTVVVVGDSVAGTVAWGLEEIAAGTPVRVVPAAFPGCGIASGIVVDERGEEYPWARTCYENVPRTLEKTVAEQQPDVVVWLSSWELADRLDPDTGEVLKLGTAAHERALLQSIDEQVQRLTTGGARVVLLTLAPRSESTTSDRDAEPPGNPTEDYNRLLQRYARQHRDKVTLVDIVPFVCPGGAPCPQEVHGVLLRPDGGHFTEETSPILARWLMPKLILAKPS
jgi:peptidoglycan/LPS O-acetylase OafA/YrhL